MADLVPIDALPPSARAQVTPGSPGWLAYAQRLEQDYDLTPGSLGGAAFQLRSHQDPLGVLQAAARAAKDPSLLTDPPDPAAGLTPVPAHLIPPALSGAAAVPRTPAELAATQAYNASKGFQEFADPTGSFVENLAAGFQKSYQDTSKGLGQLAGVVPQSAVDESRRLDAPLMNTWGGTLGNMAGTVVQTMLPGALAARGAGAASAAVQAARMSGTAAPLAARALAAGPAAQAATLGAGFNALQPVASGETRPLNALEGAAGGAAGQALPSVISGLGRAAAQSAANPAVAAAVTATLDANKIPYRAAQVSANPWLRYATMGLDALPFGSGAALKGRQSDAFNLALARTMGQDTADASNVLPAARARMSGVYDDVKQRNNLQLDPWHVDALNDVADAYTTDITKGRANLATLRNLHDVIVNSTDPAGVIDGGTYKSLYSKIGSLAQGEAAKVDPDFKLSLKQTQGVLKRAFNSGLSPEDAALMDLTDKQWGNMRTLEAIAPKTADGDFEFGRLPQVLAARGNANQANRSAMLYGTGDQTLPDLARAAPVIGRGAGLGSSAPSWLAGRAGKLTLGGAEAAGIGGGLYALNAHEESPWTDTALDLAKVALGAKLLGSANNSQWFARGVPSLYGLGTGATRGGLAQLGTGYVNAAKGRVPPDEPGQ